LCTGPVTVSLAGATERGAMALICDGGNAEVLVMVSKMQMAWSDTRFTTSWSGVPCPACFRQLLLRRYACPAGCAAYAASTAASAAPTTATLDSKVFAIASDVCTSAAGLRAAERVGDAAPALAEAAGAGDAPV
jgi:hypothetical protein